MAVRMTHHLGSVATQLRYEPTRPRVRALVQGEVIVDSLAASLAWEPRRVVPVYAIPEADFRFGVAPTDPQPIPADLSALPPFLGPAGFQTHTCLGTAMDIQTPSGLLPEAGFQPDDPDLEGRILLDFDAFDSWLIEDEPRVGHAHDPFKRINVLASSRQVEVSLGDTVLAASDRPLVLMETHLPPRWYLPPEDVRTELLVPSDHRTVCAYKGQASYLTVPGRAENICWRYEQPLEDAVRVKDYFCFWSERTDLKLDGVAQPRPVSPWSPPEALANLAPGGLEFG